MKRKYTFIIMMSLTMGLVGCSSSEASQTTDTEMVTEQESFSEAEEITEEITTENMDTEDTAEDTEESGEMSETKITVSYETIEEDKKDDDGNILVKLSYQRPTVIVGGKEDVNARIKQEFDKDEEAFKIQGDEMARDTYYDPIDDSTQSYSSNSISYTDKRLDETIISFERVDHTYYANTPHGQMFVSGLNFDTKTGAILHLEDITENKEDFLMAAKEYILKLCETDEYKDILNPNYEESVDGLLQEDLWYFDEKGITFIANVYEMASYSEGVLYFTIPYEELQGVKEEYIK